MPTARSLPRRPVARVPPQGPAAYCRCARLRGAGKLGHEGLSHRSRDRRLNPTSPQVRKVRWPLADTKVTCPGSRVTRGRGPRQVTPIQPEQAEELGCETQVTQAHSLRQVGERGFRVAVQTGRRGDVDRMRRLPRGPWRRVRRGGTHCVRGPGRASTGSARGLSRWPFQHLASLSASIRLVGRSELRWSPGHPLLTSHGFLRWDLASMNKTFKHSKHCQCKSGFAFKGARAHGEPGFLCRRQLVSGRLGSGMEVAGSVVVRLAACGLSEGHRSSWGKLAVLKSGHTSSRQEGMTPSL